MTVKVGRCKLGCCWHTIEEPKWVKVLPEGAISKQCCNCGYKKVVTESERVA